MTEMVEMITIIFALFTVLGQVFLLSVLVQSFTKKGRASIAKMFSPRVALLLAFIIASSSMVGTLYYSEIVGFEVCKLCWAQRIFLYSDAVLLGLALWRSDFRMAFYSFALACLGVFFAVYHILVQATDGGVSCGATVHLCSKIYFSVFGYITFPVMATTVFLLVGVFSGMAYLHTKDQKE